MQRNNQRSGAVDKISVSEGGTGTDNLSTFRTENNFISDDDSRILKTTSDSAGGALVQINSISDLGTMRPDISGPHIVTINETASFTILNRDISVSYNVATEDGFISYQDGHVQFTPNSRAEGKTNASFTINGFDYDVEIAKTGPLTGAVLTSGVKTDSSVLLKVKATEFATSSTRKFAGVEFQVATDFDFDNVLEYVKTDKYTAEMNLPYYPTLYTRARFVDTDGVYSAWFYSVPLALKDSEYFIARPQIACAVIKNVEDYTLLIKGSPFISTKNIDLKSIYVEISGVGDHEILYTNEIIQNSTDIAIPYTKKNTELYIRVYYIDATGVRSDWSEYFGLDLASATSLTPSLDVGTLLPSHITVGNYGTNFAIAKSGTVMVAGDSGASTEGLVYIYQRKKGTWDLFQTLTLPQTMNHICEFGKYASISADGKKIFISSPRKNANLTGVVCVVKQNPTTGVWEFDGEITDPQGTCEGSFGNGFVSNANGTEIIIFDNQMGTVVSGKSRLSPRFYHYKLAGSVWNLAQTVITGVMSATVNEGIGEFSIVNDAFTRLIFTNYNSEASSSGAVKHYTFANNTWTLKQTIDTPAPAKFLGRAPTITADEKTLVLQASSYVNAGKAGQFMVYKLDQYNLYSAVGNSFYTNADAAIDPALGSVNHIVAVDPNGRFIAASSLLKSDEAGRVDFYIRSGDIWVKAETVESYDKLAKSHFGSHIVVDAVNNEIVISETGSRKALNVFKAKPIVYRNFFTSSDFINSPINAHTGFKLGTQAVSTITANNYGSRTNTKLKNTILEIAMDPNFSRVIHSDKVAGNVFTYGHPDLNVKHVRSKFIDENDTMSHWSDTTVIDPKAYATGMSAPVITGSIVEKTTIDITVNASAPTNTANLTAIGIEIEISDTTNFNNPEKFTKEYTSLTNMVTTSRKYLVFKVRMRYVMTNGLYSDWSNAISLDRPIVAPDAPVLTMQSGYLREGVKMVATASPYNNASGTPMKEIIYEVYDAQTRETETVKGTTLSIMRNFTNKWGSTIRAKYVDTYDLTSAWSNVLSSTNVSTPLISNPDYTAVVKCEGFSGLAAIELTFKPPVLNPLVTNYKVRLNWSITGEINSEGIEYIQVINNKASISVYTKLDQVNSYNDDELNGPFGHRVDISVAYIVDDVLIGDNIDFISDRNLFINPSAPKASFLGFVIGQFAIGSAFLNIENYDQLVKEGYSFYAYLVQGNQIPYEEMSVFKDPVNIIKIEGTMPAYIGRVPLGQDKYSYRMTLPNGLKSRWAYPEGGDYHDFGSYTLYNDFQLNNVKENSKLRLTLTGINYNGWTVRGPLENPKTVMIVSKNSDFSNSERVEVPLDFSNHTALFKNDYPDGITLYMKHQIQADKNVYGDLRTVSFVVGGPAVENTTLINPTVKI